MPGPDPEDMTQVQASNAPAAGKVAPEPQLGAAPRRIGGRYRVCGELGRGGMSKVYHVVDENDGRHLALKLLLRQEDSTLRTRLTLLFEREFHTLSQLRHPRVIAVYDYGLDDAGAYYTMEMLDGGDLRERSPVPWREACRLTFEVCSSLALLHSRRLLHCDISPRNIRCTRDLHAKLIDFGAMAVVGPARQVVGTPAFIAPEMAHRSTLDARTDLFSLGATLYFTLTGRTPFRAMKLSEVFESWAHKPVPPSAIVPEIPAELDALVASMLSLEPALRPRSAFDIMQRLAGIAGLQGIESVAVSQAYLSTPLMVGRDAPLFAFRTRLHRALAERGGGILIEGAAGLGRSRLLDACVLEAKTLGATVLRARATGARTTPLAAAAMLAEQFVATLPDIAILTARTLGAFDTLFESEPEAAVDDADGRARLKQIAGSSDLSALQSALSRWFLRASETVPLMIAVDDVDGLDEPSIGLLAALANDARRNRLLVTGTVKSNASGAALTVLANYCNRIALRPLELEETESLLRSIFDDVPNVRMLSSRIHAVAGGRPRECMALAQHLLDAGKIEYRSGIWTLPEELNAHELPASVRDMLRARLATLSSLARGLAEAHALSICESLTRADYGALRPDAPSDQLDDAITSLVAHEVLTSDGFSYMVSNDELRAELVVELDEGTRRERHAALAGLFERTSRPVLFGVHHLLLAERREAALDRLFPLLRTIGDWTVLLATSQMLPSQVARCVASALDVAERLGRSARDVNDLRSTLMLLSATADNALYWRTAPPLLAQLERDSGLIFWRELTDIADPMQRVIQALTRAGAQYEATPEQLRVYRPDEAIKLLVSYAVSSIPAAMRSYDTSLMRSLPALLEPFAPLAPVLRAMWQNTIASLEQSENRPEPARLRWMEIYRGLEGVSATELPGAPVLRAAMAYGIGLTEAHLGIETANSWAEILERDDLQRVTAMYLRKTILLQLGDFEGAERERRRAELRAIQVPGRQPFNTLALELAAHAAAEDLRGVKQIADRIQPLAAQYPGWRPYADLARAITHRLRGELPAACAAFERGLADVTPDAQFPGRAIAAWPSLVAGYVEVLVELGRYREAKVYGDTALAKCAELGMQLTTRDIHCSVALAEGRLDDYAAAAARLDALIAKQRSYNIVGLSIGVSYEARTRVAIWARDHEAVDRFAALTAQEYRYGSGSPLGARYERLMREAQAVGIDAPVLVEFESTLHLGRSEHHSETERMVLTSMHAAKNPTERALCALNLLCEAHAAPTGHLYLFDAGTLRYSGSKGGEAAPDPAFAQRVSEYFQSQCEEAPTVYLTDQPDAQTTGFWSDGKGTSWLPLLLRCELNGELVYAGVAVIASSLQLPSNTNMPISSWIAARLLEAGDTPGLRAA